MAAHRMISLIALAFPHRYIQKGDKLALLLDFDGTLAGLVAHPDLAVMETESEFALRNLEPKENVFIAIISGRAAEDARSKVNLKNVTYAGNHGFEIIFPDQTRYSHQVDEKHRRNFVEMVKALETDVSTPFFFLIRKSDCSTTIVAEKMIE